VAVPARPLAYHITHVDNLSRVLADGGLLSDAIVVARGGPAVAIGMSTIKERRLRELLVKCHPETFVGEYVPFYFCPRSIMLYLLHMGNHPELSYRGGQGPIIHLVADVREIAEWAGGEGRRWAFSLSNAGARYTEFRNSLERLGEVDWDAVANNDFRSPEVRRVSRPSSSSTSSCRGSSSAESASGPRKWPTRSERSSTEQRTLRPSPSDPTGTSS
jgi:hypothetical protein